MLILGLDLSFLHTGFAVIEVDASGERILQRGAIDVPGARGKKVCEGDQLIRSGCLYSKLSALIRSWPQLGVVAYETPAAWMGGKAKQRGMSNRAVRLTGAAQGILWAAIQCSGVVDADAVIGVDPNKWQRNMFAGLLIPTPMREKILQHGGAKMQQTKINAYATVLLRHHVMPASDHEADAICIASYIASLHR